MSTPKKLSDTSLEAIRAAFPILNQWVNDRPLVYFDNAATTQKPQVVLDVLQRFYGRDYANIHRGVHALSQRATEDYENARRTVAGFLNARSEHEIVFVRGTTEAINLVAHSFGQLRFREGDRILLTGMEHHANIVPWQLLAERLGLRIDVLPVTENGELSMEQYEKMLEETTPKLVSCVHVSNSLGTVNPVKEIISQAHAREIPVLIDAAQSIPHFPVDVQDLDCDFLAFSGHKAFGPTGIGVLYGKRALLEEMPPYQGGGDMIQKVSFEGTRFKGPPERFEAGTPHIAGAIGLAAALEYLSRLDRQRLTEHEQALLTYAEARLDEIPGLKIIGRAREKASVVSFILEDAHPHDIGSFLDADGIAIRAGHHCTQPLMQSFGLPGTARASFAFYNSIEEIDKMVEGVARIQRFFS